MERLTNRSDDGQAFMNCEECEASWCKKSGNHKTACTAIYCRNRLKDRLAAYEDTGLEPEEIKDNMEMFRAYRHICAGHEPEHIRDLLQAERDGRLVALPCKVGDKVYQIDAERVYESEVKGIIYDAGHIDFDERAIGKTVFLTREEAEAALKGGEG